MSTSNNGGKRVTTPKQQRARSATQKKSSQYQEDVCVRTSLPPLVEGPVHAILICHIPKLRWNTKHQSLCRSVNIKISWWGEDETSSTFRPQISGTMPDHRQVPSTTAKYYIRSELKQFAKYLTDAVELVLRVYDGELNRLLGTAKVQHLSTLNINNPIKGYQSIFNSKGEKLGEVLVALRMMLPGTHDSNENLAGMSLISDTSNPPSRRNSFGNKNDLLENGLRTYNLDRPSVMDSSLNTTEASSQAKRYDSTVPFQSYTNSNAQPGVQSYQDVPTGQVVEALIERANRLREEMIKSSGKTLTNASLNQNNNNAELLSKSVDLDNDTAADLLGLKASAHLNDSNESILTDLDGLENEQSLLDDLLYGGRVELNPPASKAPERRTSHGKPPTGRSRSPSLARVGSASNRPRSSRSRSRSLAQSSDSDTASRVSFDMPNSDLDDSGNESHEEESLSKERLQLLSFVRTARVRIDHLKLHSLATGRDSPSHSSFGRTNKSKRALSYFIEYQFPVMVNSRDGQKNQATEVMKIASKRFDSNNDIVFSHLSTYPCLFTEPSLKHWWRSLLIFKIYSRMSGTGGPEQLGFAVLPLRNILKADCLHLEEALSVIDRSQGNQQKIPNRVAKKFCIGQLHVMLELDSDAQNFKLELDRVHLLEQMKPKKTKTKKTKKSKKIVLQPSHQQPLPKAFSSEGFLNADTHQDMTDGVVVQIYLSIEEARNIPPVASNQHLPRNPYFVCRAFWNEEPITSVVSWGSAAPRFNFEQKIPILLTRSTLEKMHQNFIVIEMWDKKISGPTDQLIGIVKIPLEQFYISFKDKQITRVLLRAQYPVISTDAWLRIIDPFVPAPSSQGELKVLLAMGTPDQLTAVQVARSSGAAAMKPISNPSNTAPTPSSSGSSSVEHQFEVMIESINGLRAFESMVWGESDCFIQYSFPIQPDHEHTHKPFQLKTIRTAATLCTSDPTFHDCNKFRYVLSPADALHKYFYAACQSSAVIDTSIPFEVWSRFYYPNIRDQLLAKGKLPAAKLCGMTTMLSPENENKSIQSFRIPLEIVRDDRKGEQHHYSSTPTYGGDLLVTVTYKRNVLQTTDRPSLLLSPGQVCITVGVIRACGLKNAIQSQTRHDPRLTYPAQVGVNAFAKLSLSFLSDLETRTTRTVARSFVPEFNHSIDFPVQLIWTDHRQHRLSLAEMLEHGELKLDLYHQINPSDNNEKQKPVDILFCTCTISLRELISRHTGMKGWYPLASVQRQESAEITERCVGGIELFIRFAQQDDRRRVMESAKALGWIDDQYLEEGNYLDDQKDLGCLVTLSIDRIQFPMNLACRPGKDRIDDRTSVFVQYRFYDKMPIITKRKKPILSRDQLICDLQFHKEHLFLCSEPFLWYLREEKLEIQIWTSENDTFDYSPSVASTDKLIGSVYVDLHALCDRKRKSHRINAILPIFKAGTKDLAGATVQVHVTLDKSKDFNELRTRNGLDTSNDAELDSYLEHRHANLIGNDRALRTITNNVFSVIVNIEQAAHLPTIYSKQDNAHVPPNAYVTYSTADSNHLCRTQVLTSTCKPVWNYQQAVKLAVEHLFNDKKTFILKVWHKVNADIETIPEKSGDKVLGFVSIDLSPLLSGLQQISGWYNIVDTIGNVQGQLKISIVPQEDLFELKRFKYNSSTTMKQDSHRSNASSSHPPPSQDLSSRSISTSSAAAAAAVPGQPSLNTSMIDDESNKQSFLMSNLRRQLGELDTITERLKARYFSGSEASSTTTTNTARSASIPPPTPLNLPTQMDTHRPETDSNRSTIRTDFLEQFPESLSGRPLMSNGLNVTDILTLHNDQVRLAQELMSKANHLLEASKDVFTKPASPPPPPPALVSTASPPALPRFEPTPERNDHPRRSLDEHPVNHSIMWSEDDDEPNDPNESFLPIGLPPIQHRPLVTTSTSPLPVEEREKPTTTITFPSEPVEEIDVVHLRPLNNLSAFNFDCEQMNAAQPSPPATNSARRTIFPTDESPKERSSSSASPPLPGTLRQSFTSDTSVIDRQWLDQQKERERVPSATVRQPPSRSPHLAFLDRPIPNFFPSNREMEASMKQILDQSSSTATATGNPPMKTIIDRLRTKSSNELLRGVSPVNGPVPAASSDSSASNVNRLEKIFKTKFTPAPSS